MKYRVLGLLIALLVAAGCTTDQAQSPTTTPQVVPGTAVSESIITESSSATADSATADSATANSATADSVDLPQAIETQLQTYSFFPNIRAVLVAVNGELIYQNYWETTADESRNTYSVTKSVMSILVGIARDEGLLTGLDQTLDQLLPAYAAQMRPEVAAITLEQLLTMTSGLPALTESGVNFTEADDWVAAILEQGTDHPAGEFVYSDAGAHLISPILVQATGMSVLEYARAKLFTPLGIDSDDAYETLFIPANGPGYDAAGMAWPIDPQGNHLGAFFLKLRPTDLMKLGQLFLDRGRVGDVQVVSEAWVQQATSQKVAADIGDGYGYLWWTGEADGAPGFAAAGNAGQLIEVVPDRGLVVVVSSAEPSTEHPTAANAPELMQSLVSRVIAPAIPSG